MLRPLVLLLRLLPLRQPLKGLARSQNVEYLDALGSVLAETGQQEDAITVLRRAVELQPEKGFSKYMYLGQLLDGEEALAALQKGVSVLQSTIDSQEMNEGEEDEEELQARLSSALCTLAETHMGQANEVSDVAEECEALLLRAAQADPTSPEPMQALASLRVEQGRPEEALHCLRQSISTWCPDLLLEDGSESEEDADEGEASAKEMEQEDAGVGTSGEQGTSEPELNEDIDSSEEEDDYDDDELPTFEFRFETAKLLIELDDKTHAATKACSLLLPFHVLEGLIAEDDSVPDVWYLLGLSLHAGGDFEDALTAANEAERLTVLRKHDISNAGEFLLDLEELKAAIKDSMVAVGLTVDDKMKQE
ncbi:TPR-like protein [Coccomyxa subellipsoidea C-169]|uniref:TPR-like protein n=1 Tax=Coccomyxa subellipsoidea (strain C-169) TaxID=574566 RepID=I0Z5A6_COCSC|nr:TPR-like protein [Coccomyxa subellipsoidea C-169]EIE25825.1 TPR-like protein [Coccomyxa subellipsoidea C-169]|eukprot:XP_005650369.1 TPR-like protein [Coccomyxa subellipsoidea C-169]